MPNDPLGQLGINLPGLIAQIINFGLVVLLLWLLAWKPILRMLDQRREKIQDSLTRAEQLKQQTEQGQAEIQAQLDAARREGQQIVANAQQVAERTRQVELERARGEADRLIERAREEINLERDRVIQDLRREFADLTVTAAEKVINQSLDGDRARHERLIDDVLRESRNFRSPN